MELRYKELPPLAAGPALLSPTQDDWTRLRPEIERLYIQKRWKLRHVMQHVEDTYRLSAS